MRGAAPFFVALLAIMGCAMVLAEEEGQPMTEYLKEGILAGARRGSTAAGAYSWGNNDGASSNRAGNDEEDDEDDLLGEPNENQIRILKKRNKELEAQTRELRQKVPQTSRESVVQTSLDLARDVGETAAAVGQDATKATKWSEAALKVAKQGTRTGPSRKRAKQDARTFWQRPRSATKRRAGNMTAKWPSAPSLTQTLG